MMKRPISGTWCRVPVLIGTLVVALMVGPGVGLAAFAVPPAVFCDPAECQACLEYSADPAGAGDTCMKCTDIEGRRADKSSGKLPRSPFSSYGRALNDVDIYDSPVEPRRVIGMMKRAQEGSVMEQHPHG